MLAADARYPSALRDLPDPPAALWYAGEWNALVEPVVAIVGTRRATSYGLRITRELSQALARAGACVVSGMALGIDAMAHRAALDAGGHTVAVLGTGADVAYPRSHAALHSEIAQRGLILSEMPPGARSHRGSFIKRNRVIAGLARLTLVVEAPALSGALNTASVALDLGRDVAVVPGPIDSPQSAGTNGLLHTGAHPITCVDDLLTLVGLPVVPRTPRAFDHPVERAVWDALSRSAGSLDELCARVRVPVSECLTVVTALELRGAIECALTGEIRRR